MTEYDIEPAKTTKKEKALLAHLKEIFPFTGFGLYTNNLDVGYIKMVMINLDATHVGKLEREGWTFLGMRLIKDFYRRMDDDRFMVYFATPEVPYKDLKELKKDLGFGG